MQRFFNNVISPKYQKSQAQFYIELAERMSNVCQQVSIRSHRPQTRWSPYEVYTT